MEEILFDGYRKFLKDTQDNVFKSFLKMPFGGRFYLSNIILCVIVSIIVVGFTNWILVSVILLGVEIILCVASYFYVENYQIKTSGIRVVEYKAYCKEIMQWLKSNDIEVSRDNLYELKRRIWASWESREHARKKGIDRVEKWVQALLIPLLLAVFSEIIDGQTDVGVLVSSMLVLIVAIGIVCATVINCYNMVSFFQKRKLEQMRKFANDIQGIIDTQFEDSLIKKITVTTAT